MAMEKSAGLMVASMPASGPMENSMVMEFTQAQKERPSKESGQMEKESNEFIFSQVKL
jgi:hypothetical protein